MLLCAGEVKVIVCFRGGVQKTLHSTLSQRRERMGHPGVLGWINYFVCDLDVVHLLEIGDEAGTGRVPVEALPGLRA